GDRYPGGKVERREVVIREDELRKVGLSIEDVKKEWLKVYDMYVEEERKRGETGFEDIEKIEYFETVPNPRFLGGRTYMFGKRLMSKYLDQATLKKIFLQEGKVGDLFIEKVYYSEKYGAFLVLWKRVFDGYIQEEILCLMDNRLDIVWFLNISQLLGGSITGSILFYTKGGDIVLRGRDNFLILRDIIYKY
ncbi:MAG: hypothetical protein ABDH28_00740, partial [Brevinematia bacterium]